MTRYAQRCSADRLRKLEDAHRYAVLACFLRQVYRDTIDYIVEMHDKVMTGVYGRAQTEVDEELKRQRKTLRTSLHTFKTLGQIILDEGVEDSLLREILFQAINQETLSAQIEAVDTWLNGNYSHVFHRVTQRFSYLRQFAPALLDYLEFNPEEGNQSALFEGIDVLRELNAENKRKLPEDAPTSFIPKTLRPFVEAEDGALDKRAWECALLTVIRDEIKAGNLYIGDSKRFGRFDDFFISDTQWQTMRSDFFKRAGLPEKEADVPDYLTERLNDVTQTWGTGRTSSSDGQRFQLTRKVLQRTYSHKLSDYAIEFYAFVADNYAPFYSTVIECTDRDAPYVLDGLLYNESDLALLEHYTDTSGYTEINFAAFAMLGRRFAPRIRGLKKQRIYRIDEDKDYGSLDVLVGRRDRRIHMDWICDQWDRMGHFYASLESGHATASTALKRLASYSGKNHFYRANRELGRIFKTEHILKYMSDPVARQKIRRGLLKGEQMHALARQVAYGKQGKISNRDLQDQKNTSSCLTLIMAVSSTGKPRRLVASSKRVIQMGLGSI